MLRNILFNWRFFVVFFFTNILYILNSVRAHQGNVLSSLADLHLDWFLGFYILWFKVRFHCTRSSCDKRYICILKKNKNRCPSNCNNYKNLKYDGIYNTDLWLLMFILIKDSFQTIFKLSKLTIINNKSNSFYMRTFKTCVCVFYYFVLPLDIKRIKEAGIRFVTLFYHYYSKLICSI